MLVFVAMIIVYMRGDHEVAHYFQIWKHAALEVCVPNVKTQTQIGQPRVDNKLAQVRGRAQLPRRIFEGNRDAALLGENMQVLEGIEGGIEAPRVGIVARGTEMLDEVAKGHVLGHVQHALDFIHRFEAPRALEVGDGKRRAAFPRGTQFALRGRVYGPQREVVVPQRAAEFAHSVLRTVVEMAARAEKFHRLYAVARDLRDELGSELALDE